MPQNPNRLYKKNLLTLQSYKPSSGESERDTHVGHVRQMSDNPQQTRKDTMTRSRATAKQAGAKAERDVADYLANALDDDRIDRRVKTGNKDRGDIGGVRVRGQRLAIEVKNCARTDLAGWIAEAQTEAGNDDALAGIVIAKRKGTTNVGRWYVHMTVTELVALITGQKADL